MGAKVIFTKHLQLGNVQAHTAKIRGLKLGPVDSEQTLAAVLADKRIALADYHLGVTRDVPDGFEATWVEKKKRKIDPTTTELLVIEAMRDALYARDEGK